jgi:hypothetical protein
MARKFRTPAERMEAAVAQAKKIKEDQLKQAQALREQAVAWRERAAQLNAKADGADAKAEAIIEQFGTEELVRMLDEAKLKSNAEEAKDA